MTVNMGRMTTGDVHMLISDLIKPSSSSPSSMSFRRRPRDLREPRDRRCDSSSSACSCCFNNSRRFFSSSAASYNNIININGCFITIAPTNSYKKSRYWTEIKPLPYNIFDLRRHNSLQAARQRRQTTERDH